MWWHERCAGDRDWVKLRGSGSSERKDNGGFEGRSGEGGGSRGEAPAAALMQCVVRVAVWSAAAAAAAAEECARSVIQRGRRAEVERSNREQHSNRPVL